MTRPIKTPGPDHPIDLRSAGRALRAACAGSTLAMSAHALVMSEAGRPDVVYFPRDGVDFTMLERSATSSWCPYKGEASYFSLRANAGASDVAWSYEAPLPAMTDIAGRVAFYADKVRIVDA